VHFRSPRARLRVVEESAVTSYVEAPDGVRIAYQVIGEGPLDILWIPPFAYPVDVLWDEPGFRHFAKRLRGFSRSIWYELRGAGASGGSPLDRFRESTFKGDLTALLDACACDEVPLVGMGQSGPGAIRYAVSHPERITVLILIDSHAHLIQEPDYPIGASADELEQLLGTIKDRWGTGISAALAPSKAGDAKFIERIARAERLSTPPDLAVESVRLAYLQDVRHLLPRLTIPTLVVHREEASFPGAEASRYLAEHIPGAKYVELPGIDTLFLVGDVDGLVDEIEEFLTGGHQGPEGDVLTATVLFTDIVSSTEQSARLGHRKWTTLTDDHDAMVRATLSRYRGHEVKSIGDGFLATFDATTRAVRAASEIVIQAKALGIDVRAGVHVGEVEVRPDDVVGLTVSIAKRVCDLAAPGQVWVSAAVPMLVSGSGITFDDRGEHELKGVPDTWKLWAVKR